MNLLLENRLMLLWQHGKFLGRVGYIRNEGTSLSPSAKINLYDGTTITWQGDVTIKRVAHAYILELVASKSPVENLPGMKATIPCPGDDCYHERNRPWPLMYIIIHLNDHHMWSREKIADWLDTLDLDLRFK